MTSDLLRRVRGRLAVGTLLLVVTLGGCATNPVSGRKQITLMSEAQEIEAGREGDRQVRAEMGVYDDPELQRYVDDIGQRLARISHRPNLPWTFAIVDSPAVNAFALPGGFIFITRGILPYLSSEAELAGVIGHEIGHVTARHAVEQYTRSTGAGVGMMIASIFVPAVRPFGDLASTGLGVFFLKYGRDDELQADRLGAEYAARGGWDPDGVAGMLRTLSRLGVASGSDRRGVPGWLTTHPEPAARVERVKTSVEEARTLLTDGAGASRHDEFLKRLDGLMFGDNPREGVVRGTTFLHPEMRFSIEFPDGWDVVNSTEQVAANEPGTKHYVFLDTAPPTGSSRSLEDFARESARGAGFRSASGGGATQINGLDAWVGTFEGKLQDLPSVARIAVIEHERSVYRVIGIGPTESFPKIEREIERTQQSFRGLSRDEALDIEPNRVQLYTVREGDTWQSIAQRAGGGNVNAATLAIMNGAVPNEQPRPGDRIKIVVAG